VWFEAWRYQYEQAPIVALLHEIRSQLSWLQKFRRSLDRATEVAIRGALLSMEDVTKKIGLQYSKFAETSQSWDSENLASVLPSTALRSHLQCAIDQLLPTPRCSSTPSARLVVSIDDIDRCQPDTAYRLLEGLKIYLNLDNCVFVLGMNQKIVEEALAHHFDFLRRDFHLLPSPGIQQSPARDTLSNLREIRIGQARVRYRATAYMEKICQNVWQLPTVRNPGETLLTFLEHTVSRSDTRELVGRAIEGTSCLPPNPRRLKGLANAISQFEKYLPVWANQTTVNEDEELEKEAQTLEARILVIVAYIYHFHLDLYVRWESDVLFYNAIFDACRGMDSNVDALSALVMPASVADVGSSPTPAELPKSQFPDPTETNVFWIQALILSLRTEVGPQKFGRYLGTAMQ